MRIKLLFAISRISHDTDLTEKRLLVHLGLLVRDRAESSRIYASPGAEVGDN